MRHYTEQQAAAHTEGVSEKCVRATCIPKGAQRRPLSLGLNP